MHPPTVRPAGRSAFRARAHGREIALLARLGVPENLIRRALADSRRYGVSADAALLASRRIDEDAFYAAYARSIGAPFVTRGARLDPHADYVAAAAAGVAAFAGRPGGLRWLAAPQGRALVALAATPNAPGLAITTPRRFRAFLRAAAGDRLAAAAASSVDAIDPRLSALRGPQFFARACAAAATVALVVAAAFWPEGLAALAWALLAVAFSTATITRLFIAAASSTPEPDAALLADCELPIYTIVVALHREAAVAQALVRALERLDYPRALLDIKFVVEVDDADTYAALAAAIPGVEYEVIVAPAGKPRTKPRALDVALPFSRGALLTVYDAEDEPEPDQLRRAAARFAAADEMLACLQARLAIDNSADNWLTGLFAIDYASLFETANPGVAALGLPMLLGGTSNHFRTDVLRAIGGWDAWNVTEDADLGVRLARYGFRVETLASHTFEEAPNTLTAFLHQRTRWMKGWMQTAFVHLHDPAALWRNLRPLAFCTTLAAFVSGVLSPLLWPWFAAVLVRDVATGALFAPDGWGETLVDTCAVWLAIAGPIATLWPALLGMRRQGLTHLWPRLFLLPVWHVLLSVAAWRAVFDLWRNPFGWAKTTHGAARARNRPDQRQLANRPSIQPIARATARPNSDSTSTPASN